MSAVNTGDKLAYMANQIAAFFDSQPGDTAPLQIAEHITAFWTPSMRREITAWLDAGGEGLKPAAAAAVGLLKARSDGSVARELAVNGKRPVGHLHGDDAG